MNLQFCWFLCATLQLVRQQSETEDAQLALRHFQERMGQMETELATYKGNMQAWATVQNKGATEEEDDSAIMASLQQEKVPAVQILILVFGRVKISILIFVVFMILKKKKKKIEMRFFNKISPTSLHDDLLTRCEFC